MSARDEIVSANEQYAGAFDKGDLPMPPARRFAVVTCMDARLDPAAFLGLAEGDAHVIRNAGGIVTDDAIRSLVISHHLLGTQQAFVIGHTDCGMVTFTNDHLHDRLGPDATGIDFQPFPDVSDRVKESLRRIEESSLLPDGYAGGGFVYDVHTGRLDPVA